jgi:hypothetical protein
VGWLKRGDVLRKQMVVQFIVSFEECLVEAIAELKSDIKGPRRLCSAFTRLMNEP